MSMTLFFGFSLDHEADPSSTPNPSVCEHRCSTAMPVRRRSSYFMRVGVIARERGQAGALAPGTTGIPLFWRSQSHHLTGCRSALRFIAGSIRLRRAWAFLFSVKTLDLCKASKGFLPLQFEAFRSTAFLFC